MEKREDIEREVSVALVPARVPASSAEARRVHHQPRIEKGLSAQHPKPSSEDEANNYKAREYTAKHNESARVEGGSRLMLAR